jgi:hypothetical protein
MTIASHTSATNTEGEWHLGEPSQSLHAWATATGVELRPERGEILSAAELKQFQPLTRLGRLLPSLIPQLLELGVASLELGRIAIVYEELTGIEDRGIDALDGCWRWSPFSIELQSTGWLQDTSFGYFVRFYLGNRPVDLRRRGCFVRRGEEIYRLDRQSYSLLQAIESFSKLPPEARTGTDSMLHFVRIKGLAEEVGAQLDQYLTKERVLVPARLGLDVIVDDEQRITFVPKVDGVPDEAIRESFLALDEVDDCYACATAEGGRIRVVLSAVQQDVLRRMQRVRHVGGAERAEIMRNPYSVFDGVAEAVEVDLKEFGPRVRGVGDFPFVARPYLQRSVTGIFDDHEEPPGNTQRSRFVGGLECTYADGTTERVAFKSRDELLRLKSDATEAYRSGRTEVEFGGKSIVVDQKFVDALRGLANRVTPPVRIDKEPKADPRRYVLIYTNEDKLEYEEEYGEAAPHPKVELPSALDSSVQLKKHQREGVEWLQRNFRLRRHGCLLADDMGLGKTLQTLVFLAGIIEKGALSDEGYDPECAPWNPILIVAPVILLENEVWINDMKRFFVGDGAVFQPWLTLHGSTLQKYRRPGVAGRETMIGEPVLDLDALRQFRVILTNYETVTNYQHSFARMRNRWTVVVTDEAQEYKTPSTKVSHALKSLDPRFRIACTGTPVETRLLDVWNILDFLQPGQLLGSSNEFSHKFERSGADESNVTPTGTQVQELRRVLRYGAPDAFVLRRNKADILSDLPTKHEEKLRCGLSDVQRNWHLEILGRARKGGDENHPFSLISQLMRVYQHPALLPSFEPIASAEAIRLCPKLGCMVDCLERIRSNSEKALIFTRSLDMQQLLQSVLQERFGIGAEIVNGATPRKGGTRGGSATRQGILRHFREAAGFDVLILSPDVAGIGLTLVEANHVIHYGRWWNPAKESQATDRAYRIGQTRNVHVYQLIAEDPLHEFVSFDEKLDALIDRRRALAADFLAPMPSDEDLEAELLRDVLGHDSEAITSGGLSAVGSEDVRRLSWDRFEALTACLWQQPGAQVLLTPRAGDEGVDVIAIRGGVVELVQCKHTLWEAIVDADVIAELIQAFDGYRAKRFRRAQGRLMLRCTLVTNGKLSAQARRAARERDVEVCSGSELLKLLDSRRCTAADIEAANSRRLASMRDVQAKIDGLTYV